jgi:prepilin-type processing-associated H-X9-DG protein
MSDPYDPQEPEGARGSSTQYVSRKDLRVVFIVLAVMALLAWPVYLFMLKGVHKSTCAKNLHKISTAMSSYIQDYDERMPFAYQTAEFGSAEIANKGGYASTWQWALQPYTKADVDDWSYFQCPAADPAENTKIANEEGTRVVESSYGMLNAYSNVLFSTIASPTSRVVIAETVKNGALGTSDPLPLSAGGSPLVDDGFVIGFDNDPTYPNKATKFATRLAFPNTAKNGFDPEGDARHPGGIHFLFLDGHLGMFNASAGRVSPQAGGYGLWDVPRPLLQPSLKPRVP